MFFLQRNLLHIFIDTKRKKEREEYCKASAEKKSELGGQARKRKFIRGKSSQGYGLSRGHVWM